MTTGAERAGQRAAWRQALTAAAAARRSQRYRRAAPQPRAGMLRKDVTVDATPLPKCTMPGCAWRYRGGPDRPCPQHQGSDAMTEMRQRMAELAGTAPGGPDDGTR